MRDRGRSMRPEQSGWSGDAAPGTFPDRVHVGRTLIHLLVVFCVSMAAHGCRTKHGGRDHPKRRHHDLDLVPEGAVGLGRFHPMELSAFVDRALGWPQGRTITLLRAKAGVHLDSGPSRPPGLLVWFATDRRWPLNLDPVLCVRGGFADTDSTAGAGSNGGKADLPPPLPGARRLVQNLWAAEIGPWVCAGAPERIAQVDRSWKGYVRRMDRTRPPWRRLTELLSPQRALLVSAWLAAPPVFPFQGLEAAALTLDRDGVLTLTFAGEAQAARRVEQRLRQILTGARSRAQGLAARQVAAAQEAAEALAGATIRRTPDGLECRIPKAGALLGYLLAGEPSQMPPRSTESRGTPRTRRPQ